MLRLPVRLTAVLIVGLLSAALSLSQGNAPMPAHAPAGSERTIDQTGKNIKVLNGVPASQLNPMMDFFTASLGVRCNFCHVADSTGLHPELDDKGEKKTAREMIQMVMDINKKNFEGRPTVSCYTCHKGTNDPQSFPKLPIVEKKDRVDEDAQQDKAMPKAEQVLAAYEKALGGADAIGKIKSWNMKATFNRNGQDQSLEIVQEAPNNYAGTVTTERGAMTNVYAAGKGWAVMPNGARAMSENEKVRLSREAAIVPVLRLKDLKDQIRSRGTDTVNGHTAYVLMARIGDDVRERYYIDSATSLLIRRNVLNKTAVGWIPDQTDYEDYKDVNGVKMPFTVRYSYVNPRNSTVRKFSEIKANVPVDPKVFTMPELKDMPERPRGR